MQFILQVPLTGEAAVRELMASLDANNNAAGTNVTVIDGAVAKQVPVVRHIFISDFL